MKSKVHFLNKLINHEFPNAYRKIVTRIEGVELSVEDLVQSFERVQAENAELDYLKSNLMEHDLTRSIADLRDIRHQHILSLRGRVMYHLRGPLAEERVAAQKASMWLEKERKFLRSRSILGQSQSVYRLVHDLSLSVELQTAIGLLNLQTVVDALKATSKQIDEYYNIRKDDQMSATRKSLEMRHTAYGAMQTFVISLQQAIRLEKGDKEVHLRCIGEINSVVTDFYKLHLSRKTRKKNAAEEAEANQAANPENGEQETGGDDVPNGGQPAMASRKRTFDASALNGMDLLNGSTSASIENRMAMNGSVTNGGANNDATDDATKPMAGNGQMVDEATEVTDKGGTTNENDSEPES